MDDAAVELFVVALWENAIGLDTVGSLMTRGPVDVDRAEIRRVLAGTRRFDYLCGRALKLDFSRDPVDARRYDGLGYLLTFAEVRSIFQ